MSPRTNNKLGPNMPTKKRKTSKTLTVSDVKKQQLIMCDDLSHLVKDHDKRRRDLLEAQRVEKVQLKKKHHDEKLAMDAIFTDEKSSLVADAICFSCGVEVESIDKSIWGNLSVCCGCKEIRKCDDCKWPTQCANLEEHGWCTYCEKDAKICCHCEGCNACREEGDGCCKWNRMHGSDSEDSW
mmetsp:Transcript_31606/g.36312  ORF Transcript_31606/g.36312 Transcript_31606/m.36312 type:complete len:183 (-) Transcript_31606:120-668(-)